MLSNYAPDCIYSCKAEWGSIIHTFDFCTVKCHSVYHQVSLLWFKTFDLTPFLLAAGFKPSQPSQLNLMGGSWPPTSALSLPHRTGANLSCRTRTQSSVPPSFSSCVNCLVFWCSLNLSGHYSPPSAPTSHPSSLFALFHLALHLAPSLHNSLLNQQITASPPSSLFKLCSLSRSFLFVTHFLLLTSFFFLLI